jgi:hypothetical protein
MVRVLQAVFQPWPKSEISVAAVDHLRWKMASHPIAMNHHIVAEHKGDIIGVRLMFVQPFVLHGKTLLGRQGVDIAMLPAYRGQGVYTRINRMGSEAELPVFDLHLANTGRPSLLQLDYEKGNRPIANELRRLVCEAAPLDATPSSAIVDMGPFGAEVDALWREAASQFEFIGLRTASYLTWRYGDPRSGKFTVRQLWEDGRLAGYAVRHDSYGESYLVELLTLPGRPEVVAALIEDALAGCARAGFDRLFCDISTIHPYRAVLLKRGFVEKGRIMPFTVRAMRPADLDVSFISDPNARVHLMLGDTDLV